MTIVALAAGIGRLEPDGTVAVLDLPNTTLATYLRSGAGIADLAAVRVVDRLPFADADHASVAAGAAVWGVGLNFRSKEQATGRISPPEPVLFVKGASAVVGPGHPIVLPAASASVDYEGEIAVLVGATLFEASPAACEAAVVGIAAANDVTARDVMRRTGNPSLAKSFPGFGQIGSVAVSPADVGGLDAISIRTVVNGAERQSDRSDGMIHAIPELLSQLSRYTMLRPGDVVLTGTPAGTGDEAQQYLAAGDVVEVSVGPLPALSSLVASDRTVLAA